MLKVWIPGTTDFRDQGLGGTEWINDNVTIVNDGKLGKCLSFNGTNSRLSTTGFELSNKWSFALWAKDIGTLNRWQIVLMLNSNGGDSDSQMSFWVMDNYQAESNSPRFEINANGKWRSNLPYTPGEWHHFAGTYDGAKMLFYYDGENIGYQNNTNEQLVRHNLTIGARSSGADGGHVYAANYFTGLINDVRIWDNEVISPIEIKKLSQGLVAHWPLSMPGNENLIINSRSLDESHLESGNEYIDINVGQSYMDVPDDTEVTISFDLEMKYETVKNYFLIYNTNNKGPKQIVDKNIGSQVFENETPGTTIKKRVSVVTKIVDRPSSEVTMNHNVIEFYSQYNTGNVFSISNLKVELGNKATPWTPNSADSDYNTMGWSDNIEYDVSGYGHNGTKSGITYSSNTPRYYASSVFNGQDSYIKILDNQWMVQGATEVTVNTWICAKQFTRIFSCTESGGFNVENSVAGYMRWSCSVYTNEAKTTHAYYYNNNAINISNLTSGWHMLTLVYNSTGQKIYIDGVLHSQYDFISYGIHYNTNARLFLGCEANSADPTSPYLGGQLSDFRIYYTAFSEQDILSLYNTPISLSSNATLLTQGEYSEV